MQKKKFWDLIISPPYFPWIIITIIAFIFLFSGINHEGFWIDEAYSSAMVQHSFSKMIYYIVNFDKHPPLYYFFLKPIVIIFGSNEIALRSLSILGAIAMIWLSACPIRRLFGQKTALIFAGFIIILPATIIYSHEARMYIWANFFTLSGAIYGYSSIVTNKKKDWILFGIFTLAGMYTHYYSLVALFFAYAIIFTYILIKSKDRIIPYLITAGSVLLLYLPWIFILLNHTALVIKDFWIPPINFWYILYSLIVPFGYKLGYLPFFSNFVFATFFLWMIIIIYGVIIFIKKKDAEKAKTTIFFISIFFLTITFATLFSITVTPILLNRYMITCSGLFLLSFVLSLNAFKRRIVQLATCIILILLILPLDILILKEKFNGSAREIAAEIKNKMQADDIMLYSNECLLIPMWYYLPKATHIFLLPSKNSPPVVDPKFYKSDMLDITDLSEVIGKKKKIWLITSYNENEVAYINPDVLIQAGYKEKYHFTEYDDRCSLFKIHGIYFVQQNKTNNMKK